MRSLIFFYSLVIGGCGSTMVSRPADQKPLADGAIVATSHYATVPDGKMRLCNGNEMVRGEDLNTLREVAHTSGLSNIFFVCGKDISTAVRSTSEVLRNGVGSEASDPAVKGGNIWVVVHFGNAGSDPPTWVLDRVERDGGTVRVHYRRPPAEIRTHDLAPHLVWAELGQLAPGEYMLELHDSDRIRLEIARRVTVANANAP